VIDRSSSVTRVGSRFDAAGEILAALRLLTRVRLGSTDTAAGTSVTGAVAFPLVGGLVGAVGAVPLVLIGPFAPLVAGFLAIGVIAIATGALHLDGLADTADALVAPDRARAEQARKDPSVGAGGIVASILVLGIEASALAAIAVTAGGWVAGGALVVAAVAGRTMDVVTAVTERRRIAPEGFGAWFAARIRPVTALATVLIAVGLGAAVALATSSAATAIGGAAGAAVGLVLARIVVTWRRQLDGDGFGAIVELTVAATLVATVLAIEVVGP
jgi:adenosylcobinamide-GDP ribazoletransferase